MRTPWPEVTLGDICELRYGKSLPGAKRSGNGFGVFGSNGQVGLHQDALTSSTTIVVGRKGSFGEVTYSSEPCWPIDTTYYIDATCTQANLRWLYYILKALPLTELNRAAAIPGLNREDAYMQRLMLPPLSEQRRIAEVLDQADALRLKRLATLEYVDRLRRSIFDEMFGRGPFSPVTVSRQALDHREGWPWKTLTDVARLATGHTPDREVPSYWDGDIPWISLTEIRGLDGTVAENTDLHVSQDGIDHSSSVLLPAGTVCFSRTASIGFVTVMGRPMATSQDFVNWVCGDSLRPLYLMHALLRSREQLRDLSTGSTHKTIYMRVAEQFRVLVPPLALQDEFVRRIEALTSFKLRLMNSATITDCLFASLQYRAFRGEL